MVFNQRGLTFFIFEMINENLELKQPVRINIEFGLLVFDPFPDVKLEGDDPTARRSSDETLILRARTPLPKPQSLVDRLRG